MHASEDSSMSSKSSSTTANMSDQQAKKDRFANYKKSQISQSTGNLNTNRISVSFLSDLQFNDSQFYEVMYVGKIRVSHRNVPSTFIDDAIPKFIAHDKLKLKNLEKLQKNIENNNNSENDEGQSRLIRSDSIEVPSRTRAGSITCIDQNRTMVFILGKKEIRLISTADRKQVLLCKNMSDVIDIVQGAKNADHFGIICTETKDNKCEYMGYVFKCQNDGITNDIIFAVNKTISAFSESEKVAESISCEHCPVVIWHKRLVSLISGLDESKAHKVIMKFIDDDMNDDDSEIIMQKYSESDKVDDLSLHERNQFLMALVEAQCKQRQQRHVHDTLENRSVFLNQYLGGSTIFLKAKRSLAAFDHLLKRRGSSGLIDSNNNPLAREKPVRSMSLDPTSEQAMTLKYKSVELQKHRMKTSRMETFVKMGNKPNSGLEEEDSWRQSMLKKSIGTDDSLKGLMPVKKHGYEAWGRSSRELRDLWKFAGRQVITLIRMERENVLLQERQKEQDIRRMKLNYDEIVNIDDELDEIWENLINRVNSDDLKNEEIFNAIKRGVPKQQRGDVWLMLAEKYSKSHPSKVDFKKFPYYDTPYTDLLRHLTEHQHAIFIDIGRTFPRHEFFKSAFGLGQLSLFNLLKAYSIVDPEIGYCQGTAFICGVLLLHLNEQDAFSLLKHLMFERNMRNNFLPDMKHLQLMLYQLSRLIQEHLPEVHQIFEKTDVSTPMYASSWILTVFSSCFELGFVAKVYDLLFYDSSDFILAVILSLFEIHRKELLQLDGFDEITEYLKNTITKLDGYTIETLFEKSLSNEITRHLRDYKIEYNVLMDEIQHSHFHMENAKLAQIECKNLHQQLEIAEAGVERLENIRHSQQQEICQLSSQLQNQDVKIQSLADFIHSLDNSRYNIEIPTEIRRIIQNFDYQLKQQVSSHRLKTTRKISNGASKNLNVLMEQNESDRIFTSSSSEERDDNSLLISSLSQPNHHNNHVLQRNRSVPSISAKKPTLQRQKTSIDDETQDITKLDENDHPLSFANDINFTLKSMELRTIRPTNSFRRK